MNETTKEILPNGLTVLMTESHASPVVAINLWVRAGYFDEKAAGMIQQVFTEEGITVMTGRTVKQVSASNGSTGVYLDSGDKLTADVFLVATGVQPRIDSVSGSGALASSVMM